jgi:hypothetical protein
MDKERAKDANAGATDEKRRAPDDKDSKVEGKFKDTPYKGFSDARDPNRADRMPIDREAGVDDE